MASCKDQPLPHIANAADRHLKSCLYVSLWCGGSLTDPPGQSTLCCGIQDELTTPKIPQNGSLCTQNLICARGCLHLGGGVRWPLERAPRQMRSPGFADLTSELLCCQLYGLFSLSLNSLNVSLLPAKPIKMMTVSDSSLCLHCLGSMAFPLSCSTSLTDSPSEGGSQRAIVTP